MSDTGANVASQEAPELTELHDMAAHAVGQLSEGEKTVSELQEILGLSQSALSQHLAVLRRERIVRARKHAQSVSYSLSGDDATRVMETLHQVFCESQGERR
jgi:DNA-binding transcriptional ArsR family regulator